MIVTPPALVQQVVFQILLESILCEEMMNMNHTSVNEEAQ